MSTHLARATLSLAVLLLLSGCCETTGQVTCSAGVLTAAPLKDTCGYGRHYAAAGEATRPPHLIVRLATLDDTWQVRATLIAGKAYEGRTFTLPVPGSTNADVAAFSLALPSGLAAYSSGVVRVESDNGAALKGTAALTLADGSTCEVAFQLCRDSGLDIGAPPPSPSDDDDDHDFDWDD